VLDCGSSDGTSALLDQHHPNLNVVRALYDGAYNIAARKNRCAEQALAAGFSYIFNLDADNYIGAETLDWLLRYPNASAHNWSGVYGDGIFGRIGCTAEVFRLASGYPVFALGAGVHDYVFIARLASVSTVLRPRYAGRSAVQNTKVETVALTVNPQQLCYEDMVICNMREYISRPLFVPPRVRVTLRKFEFGAAYGLAQRVYVGEYLDGAVLRCRVRFSRGFVWGKGGSLLGLGHERDTGTLRALFERCSLVGQQLPEWTLHLVWCAGGKLELRVTQMPALSFRTGFTLSEEHVIEMRVSVWSCLLRSLVFMLRSEA
jgi:hypothetical protein